MADVVGGKQVRVAALNSHITCSLCRGYLVDATTVTHCLHSFCRSCLLCHLQEKPNCPQCDVTICTDAGKINIGRDKCLQDLVYKLVPGLFENEMEKRRQFVQNRVSAVGESKSCKNQNGGNSVCLTSSKPAHLISAPVSLCIQLYDRHSEFHVNASESLDTRYLQCPASTSVAILEKFIALKYRLGPHLQVTLYCHGERLPLTFTLSDVINMYGWNRVTPLRLTFTVFDPVASLLTKPGVKDTGSQITVPLTLSPTQTSTQSWNQARTLTQSQTATSASSPSYSGGATESLTKTQIDTKSKDILQSSVSQKEAKSQNERKPAKKMAVPQLRTSKPEGYRTCNKNSNDSSLETRKQPLSATLNSSRSQRKSLSLEGSNTEKKVQENCGEIDTTKPQDRSSNPDSKSSVKTNAALDTIAKVSKLSDRIQHEDVQMSAHKPAKVSGSNPSLNNISSVTSSNKILRKRTKSKSSSTRQTEPQEKMTKRENTGTDVCDVTNNGVTKTSVNKSQVCRRSSSVQDNSSRVNDKKTENSVTHSKQCVNNNTNTTQTDITNKSQTESTEPKSSSDLKEMDKRPAKILSKLTSHFVKKNSQRRKSVAVNGNSNSQGLKPTELLRVNVDSANASQNAATSHRNDTNNSRNLFDKMLKELSPGKEAVSGQNRIKPDKAPQPKCSSVSDKPSNARKIARSLHSETKSQLANEIYKFSDEDMSSSPIQTGNGYKGSEITQSEPPVRSSDSPSPRKSHNSAPLKLKVRLDSRGNYVSQKVSQTPEKRDIDQQVGDKKAVCDNAHISEDSFDSDREFDALVIDESSTCDVMDTQSIKDTSSVGDTSKNSSTNQEQQPDLDKRVGSARKRILFSQIPSLTTSRGGEFPDFPPIERSRKAASLDPGLQISPVAIARSPVFDPNESLSSDVTHTSTPISSPSMPTFTPTNQKLCNIHTPESSPQFPREVPSPLREVPQDLHESPKESERSSSVTQSPCDSLKSSSLSESPRDLRDVRSSCTSSCSSSPHTPIAEIKRMPDIDTASVGAGGPLRLVFSLRPAVKRHSASDTSYSSTSGKNRVTSGSVEAPSITQTYTQSRKHDLNSKDFEPETTNSEGAKRDITVLSGPNDENTGFRPPPHSRRFHSLSSLDKPATRLLLGNGVAHLHTPSENNGIFKLDNNKNSSGEANEVCSDLVKTVPNKSDLKLEKNSKEQSIGFKSECFVSQKDGETNKYNYNITTMGLSQPTSKNVDTKPQNEISETDISSISNNADKMEHFSNKQHNETTLQVGDDMMKKQVGDNTISKTTDRGGVNIITHDPSSPTQEQKYVKPLLSDNHNPSQKISNFNEAKTETHLNCEVIAHKSETLSPRSQGEIGDSKQAFEDKKTNAHLVDSDKVSQNTNSKHVDTKADNHIFGITTHANNVSGGNFPVAKRETPIATAKKDASLSLQREENCPENHAKNTNVLSNTPNLACSTKQLECNSQRFANINNIEQPDNCVSSGASYSSQNNTKVSDNPRLAVPLGTDRHGVLERPSLLVDIDSVADKQLWQWNTEIKLFPTDMCGPNIHGTTPEAAEIESKMSKSFLAANTRVDSCTSDKTTSKDGVTFDAKMRIKETAAWVMDSQRNTDIKSTTQGLALICATKTGDCISETSVSGTKKEHSTKETNSQSEYSNNHPKSSLPTMNPSPSLNIMTSQWKLDCSISRDVIGGGLSNVNKYAASILSVPIPQKRLTTNVQPSIPSSEASQSFKTYRHITHQAARTVQTPTILNTPNCSGQSKTTMNTSPNTGSPRGRRPIDINANCKSNGIDVLSEKLQERIMKKMATSEAENVIPEKKPRLTVPSIVVKTPATKTVVCSSNIHDSQVTSSTENDDVIIERRNTPQSAHTSVSFVSRPGVYGKVGWYSNTTHQKVDSSCEAVNLVTLKSHAKYSCSNEANNKFSQKTTPSNQDTQMGDKIGLNRTTHEPNRPNNAKNNNVVSSSKANGLNYIGSVNNGFKSVSTNVKVATSCAEGIPSLAPSIPLVLHPSGGAGPLYLSPAFYGHLLPLPHTSFATPFAAFPHHPLLPILPPSLPEMERSPDGSYFSTSPLFDRSHLYEGLYSPHMSQSMTSLASGYLANSKNNPGCSQGSPDAPLDFSSRGRKDTSVDRSTNQKK